MAAALSPHLSRALALALTPLIGRARLMDVLRARLHSPDVRLLTLIGPAGVGKTRLAVEVATESANGLMGRVVFVPLGELDDPELVLPEIAEAVGVRQSGDRPLLANLIDALGDQRLLLILDNFEQVVKAAVDLPFLLSACPGLKILVTSRASLELSAEHELPVPPLPLPTRKLAISGEVEGTDIEGATISAAPVEEGPAVALFLQRARAVEPDLDLTPANLSAIAEICRRLDGLPLAIELAAARVATLSPEALLRRLEYRLPLLTRGARNLPPRQRTLHTAIAWSYDLLTPDEQALFRRLSVFAGGFPLDLVEGGLRTQDSGLSDADRLSPSALDDLASLVGQSLVQTFPGPDGEVRFRFLETIREFGLEQLAASGELESCRHQHAAWCLALADAAEPELMGSDQGFWITRLDAEQDNFTAALEWAFAQSGQPTEASQPGQSVRPGDIGIQLAGALWQFWFAHNHLIAGRRWLDRALTLLDADDPRRIRIALGLAMLAWAKGELDRSVHEARACQKASRALGDAHGLAFSAFVLGMVHVDLGQDDAARAAFEEALALWRQMDAPQWIAHGLTQLAFVLYRQGENDTAIALCEQALVNERSRGDRWSEALTLSTLGQVVRDQADYARAAACFGASLDFWWTLDDRWSIVHSLTGLAGVAGARGLPADAATLLAAADRIRQHAGAPLSPSNQVNHDRFVDAARSQLGNEAFAAAWSDGRSMSAEEAVARARAIIPRIETIPAPPASTAQEATAGLTRRETEVLKLLMEGYSNREIADRLFISVRTGTTHVTHILSKLGVESRAAAVAFALQHGM
jgi:non-specific serine/threonine protein kinase